MNGERHYEIRPRWPFAFPNGGFSHALSNFGFCQSVLIEAICGTDVAYYFLEWNTVGYLIDACEITVEASSSLVKPRRTLSDRVVL